MFDEIYIYVPSKKQLIRISEGSGGNLTDDDLDQGYVDYIYYETHSLEQDLPEVDGGMIMLKQLFKQKYNSTKESIPAVLDMAYEDEKIDYVLLN